MEEPPLSTLINILSGVTTDIQPQFLREPHELLLEPYSDEQIHSALQIVQRGESLSEAASTEPIGNEGKGTLHFGGMNSMSYVSPEKMTSCLLFKQTWNIMRKS